MNNEEIARHLQVHSFQITLLKGELIGLLALSTAILRALPDARRGVVLRAFGAEVELAKVTALNDARIGETVLDGIERFARQLSANLDPPSQ